MIDQKIYDLDYIRELQTRYRTDPGLLERVLYDTAVKATVFSIGFVAYIKILPGTQADH